MKMLRHARPGILAIVSAWSGTLHAQRPQLTIERIVAQPALSGTAPTRPSWSPDSRWLAFLWNDRAQPTRDIWVVERGGATPRQLTGTGRDTGSARASVGEIVWTSDGRALVYLRSGDLWRLGLEGTQIERLTTDGGGKADLALSPDGRFASFRRGGDLWLISLTDRSVRQATRVGVAPIGSQPLGTYYRPDVEIGSYVWGGPTYTWSPDSRWIAVHYVDRRQIRKTPFPYYLGDESSVNLLRRGYPGDSNEVRTLGFYDVAGDKLRLLDLPDPTFVRIAGLSWSPDGQLLVDRESDTTIDRWLDLVDPASGSRKQIWHDHRETRVYNDVSSTWHVDGKKILFVGDLDERYRMYTLAPGDREPRALTAGTYDVIGEPIPVSATRKAFFVSTEASPYDRQVYSVGEEGGPATRITGRRGTYTPFPSPDGQAIALLHSDDATPTELYVMEARAGAPERRITRSQPAEFTQYAWARTRYVTFKSRIDDFTLHARILEPANLDSTRKYPVIFGPVYSNTTRNRWNGQNGLLQQLLVERGYIVVQVDVRGSTGYGRAFREKFLMDWGGGDLEDLHSAVDYLKSLSHIDGSRMGIWGSSYGGTLTVFSLLKKPGLFQAGVAGAPATEPRFFGLDDVAISRKPQTHPEAFKRNAMQYAGNLKDHLLIIHGMADDVVPFKTSVDLAEELMRRGKDFDFAFAPGATHGWSQRDYYAVYFYRKLVDYFDRHLAAGRPRN